MKKPNLFVVGAMRAGTTSFAKLLSGHPSIYVPPVKEPHYFADKLPVELLETSRFFSWKAYFEKQFPAPLHNTQIFSLENYEKIYSLSNNEKYLVDASTIYLHAPNVAAKIQNYNPEAKIIIILRDPLQRAYSHFKMDVGLGRTTETFQELMQRQVTCYKLGTLPWYNHLAMSFYKQNIANYQKYFKNVLIISFEELIGNTANELKKVSDFLGIESFLETLLPMKNASTLQKFPKLLYGLKRLGLKDYFSLVFPNSFKQRILEQISKKEHIPINLTNFTKKELSEIFQDNS